MLVDYHVHTEYSCDSVTPMEDVVKAAIEKGIKEICFTDHVDYGVNLDYDDFWKNPRYSAEGSVYCNVNYPKYFEELKYLKKKYQKQITIKFGLEFGIQRPYFKEFDKLVKKYPMDFILLSVHEINNQEFWTQEFQEGKTQQEYNEAYYKEILYLASHYKHYCCLSHLDMIVRYDLKGNYPFEKIKPIIEEIFNYIIPNGKGIEINTSSFKYKLKDLTPSKDILKLYHDMGGKIITIGSDSHITDTLADHEDEVKQTLKEIGFKYFCTFENMKPIFHKL